MPLFHQPTNPKLVNHQTKSYQKMLFQSYHQEVDQYNQQGLSIKLWTVDENNEPTLFLVNDYYYSMYIEIPKIFYGSREGSGYEDMNVKQQKRFDQDLLIKKAEHMKVLKSYILWYLAPNSYCKEDHSPLTYEIEERKPFYGYNKNTRTYVRLTFERKSSMTKIRNQLNKGIKISSLNKQLVKFPPLEDNIDPVRKMYTDLNINVADWFNIANLEDYEVPKAQKISRCKEYAIKWRSIKKPTDRDVTFLISKPWSMSYDIECYSETDNRFPSATSDECVCFMISCSFENLGDEATRKKYCIYIGEAFDMGDVNVIAVEDEATLLEQFFELIAKENPIILTGYNLGGFDNDYIYHRVNTTHANIKDCSLIWENRKPFIKPPGEKESFSKNTSNLFTIPGRITIDMMDYMKRVHIGLTKHTLNFVSNKYLKETKHDVSPKDMFLAYEASRKAQLIKKYRSFEDPEEAEEWSEDHVSFFEREWCTLDWTNEEIEKGIQTLKKVANYCVQDTLLPLRLMKQLDVWTAQVELSNLMGVALENLLTDGEQVRCFSQIYNILHTEGFVLEKMFFENMTSEGGLVTSPDVGLHDMVTVMDFASLYPSIIKEKNISYETINYSGVEDPTRFNKTSFTQDEIQVDPETGKKPNKNTKRALELTETIPYEYEYIKKEEYHGILPRLMETLLVERNKLKRSHKVLMKEYDKLEIHPLGHPDYCEKDTKRGEEIMLMCSVYQARQLAMKVSMNSIYGFLKVSKGGKLPFPDGARTITAGGRMHIKKCNYLMSDGIEELMSHIEDKDIPDCLRKYNLLTKCQIVYNDTDSCFVKSPHIDPVDIMAYGLLLQKAFSYIFDVNLILEYEQTLFVVLLVSKKRYTGIIMNPKTGDKLLNKNTNQPEMYTKGLVTAKRDGAQNMRDIFNSLAQNILNGEDVMAALSILFNGILKLFSGDIKVKDLSLMKKIGAEYKNETAEIAIFKKSLQDRGRPVKNGDKVDFLICLSDKDQKKLKNTKSMRDGDEKAGKRYWLVDEYASKSSPDIDYVLYLEKFAKPIDQVFEIVYANQNFCDITVLKNRARTLVSLNTPMTYFSKLAFNIEERSYKEKPDVTNREVCDVIYEEFSAHMSEILEQFY